MLNRTVRLLTAAALAAAAVLGLAGTADAKVHRRPRPPASYYGMHFSRVGDGSWPQAKIGSIRLWDTWTAWKDLEQSKGQWQWGRLDAAVSASEMHGAKISLVLGLTPGWASSRPGEWSLYGLGHAAPPARDSDWIEYVHAVAVRYRGRIESYEVWNEPNAGPIFWSGSVEQLAHLARLARVAVRAADSRALLVSPSVVLRGGQMGSWYLRRYAQAGGFRWADVVGVHNYPARGQSVPQGMTGYDRARRALGRAGVHLPMWDTETNMETNTGGAEMSGRDQALALWEYYRLAWRHGVRRVCWYDWSAAANIGVRVAVASGSTAPSEAGRAFSAMQQVRPG